MSKKVVKRIGIGVGLYAIFAMAVITFYPDKPQNMDWEDREQYNQVQISKLELGFQKKQILSLYTSDAADEEESVDLGGRRIIRKQTTCLFYHL